MGGGKGWLKMGVREVEMGCEVNEEFMKMSSKYQYVII